MTITTSTNASNPLDKLRAIESSINDKTKQELEKTIEKSENNNIDKPVQKVLKKQAKKNKQLNANKPIKIKDPKKLSKKERKKISKAVVDKRKNRILDTIASDIEYMKENIMEANLQIAKLAKFPAKQKYYRDNIDSMKRIMDTLKDYYNIKEKELEQ